MKKVLLIVLLLVLGGCSNEGSVPKPTQNEATNQPTYTITGIKDKRLDAWYTAIYASYSSAEECTSKNDFTGGKRYSLGSRSIKVEDGNYTIKFPLKLTGENNDCDYRFKSLDLTMRRKHDDNLYSQHSVLSNKKEISPIYFGYKGGMGSNGNTKEIPAFLETNKRYFRVSKDTTFLCKTRWFEEHGKGRLHYEAHSQFHCTMEINSDINRTLYSRNMKTYAYHHPTFGVDEIKDEVMNIDILVDKKNCKAIINKKVVPDNFRELKEPSLLKK